MWVEKDDCRKIVPITSLSGGGVSLSWLRRSPISEGTELKYIRLSAFGWMSLFWSQIQLFPIPRFVNSYLVSVPPDGIFNTFLIYLEIAEHFDMSKAIYLFYSLYVDQSLKRSWLAVSFLINLFKCFLGSWTMNFYDARLVVSVMKFLKSEKTLNVYRNKWLNAWGQSLIAKNTSSGSERK